MPAINEGTIFAGPAQTANKVTLQALTAQSGTGNNQSTPRVGAGRWGAATIFLSCTAMSATALHVWLQRKLPDDSAWQDIVAFDKLTAAGSRTADMVSSGNTQYVPADGSLTEGTILTTLFGNEWAIAYSLEGGGTATFAVFADFFGR